MQRAKIAVSAATNGRDPRWPEIPLGPKRMPAGSRSQLRSTAKSRAGRRVLPVQPHDSLESRCPDRQQGRAPHWTPGLRRPGPGSRRAPRSEWAAGLARRDGEDAVIVPLKRARRWHPLAVATTPRRSKRSNAVTPSLRPDRADLRLMASSHYRLTDTALHDGGFQRGPLYLRRGWEGGFYEPGVFLPAGLRP